MAPLMAVAAIAGTVMSAAAAKQQGDAAKAEADYQAMMERRKAAMALAEGTDKATMTTAKGNVELSDNQAKMAAEGARLTSPTLVGITSAMRQQVEGAAAMEAANAENQSSMNEAQANLDVQKGKNAAAAGKAEALATIFSGIGKMGSAFPGGTGSGAQGSWLTTVDEA